VHPREVVIEPGDLVEFFSADGWVRTVSFVLEGLAPEQAEFLLATGQDRSPPLLEAESRFVVSFAEAPLGPYPFVVQGGGRGGEGLIRVER
jgi:hypothetical protein